MATKSWAIFLIIFVTLLTSSAQILYKFGVEKLDWNISTLLTNYFIFGGLVLYGVGAVLLIVALKGGEVSVLYPIIATSYIWVTLMAVWFFAETITTYRMIGVALIVAGVASVGFGGKTKKIVESEVEGV